MSSSLCGPEIPPRYKNVFGVFPSDAPDSTPVNQNFGPFSSFFAEARHLLTDKAKTFLDWSGAKGVAIVDDDRGDGQGMAASNRMQTATTAEWWRGACLYQVYVRSFMDSNGDGEGDLRGLTTRLDYLADLGVEALWLTPVFPSPMFDSGYDVADYRDIDPRFGTLADFRELIASAHNRGIRIVLDQVYSHSSHQHPWFVESASGRGNPKADWYVWADAKPDGGPPNNWLGRFGGYAWEWSSVRRQYYLHNFLIEQPDLNLHNPEVQAEVLDTMRFWFDLGVDGMRLDVANFFMHDPQLRDNPPAGSNDVPVNPYYLQAHLYDRSRPENLPFLSRMRAVADAAGDRMLLAEISCDNQLERMAEYTAPGRLHTAYSFELLGPGPDGTKIARAVIEAGQGESWPSWAFSNHDVTRVASRWDAEGNPDRIDMFLALLLSLRGTVILYQGEELGLSHSAVPRHRLQDPEAIRFWPNHRGRDGARTPMPWNSEGPALGFSPRDGWLPAEADHAPLSVARQAADPTSTLARCRALIALRRMSPALRLGGFEVVSAAPEHLVFQRRHPEETLLCAFNFGTSPLALPENGETLAGKTLAGQLAPDGYVIRRM
jgi:alpha-glucosidase